MSESNQTVFVSYAHQDKLLCEGLVRELGVKGVEVWTDAHLSVGRSFNESIAQSIYQCRAVVLISTGNSQRSDYIAQEIGWALDLGRTVCEVSVSGNEREELKDIQRVNFDVTAETDKAWHDVVRRLLPDLKRAIGPSRIFIAHELADIPKYCWECRHLVALGDAFCTSCGIRLIDEPPSHDAAEKDFVDWVVDELQAQGLDCWYEQGMRFVGRNREKMIDDAIDRAGVNLAIVSEAAVRSERFCRQIMRALDQDDDVVWILHQTLGTSESDLKESWRDSMRSVVGGELNGAQILKKFEEVVQNEPARFKHEDQEEMRDLVATLREKQDHYRTDPEQDRRSRVMMVEFIAAAKKRGLDPARVLSLKQDAAYGNGVTATHDGPTPGPTSGDISGPLSVQADHTEFVKIEEGR